jgi:pyruvate dehydrogenase E2 component (dihydrolipoamide acetyltransferase)
MPTEVEMPKLGLTMTEGTVVEWLKTEGEAIEKGEPLFVLETDKITLEAEAPVSGILGQILVTPGTTVPTGTAVGLILVEAEEMTVPARRAAEHIEPQQVQEKVKATPVARRLAAEAGLDLSAIKGTGPGGRVTRDDVERARTPMREEATDVSAGPAPGTAPPAQPPPVSARPKARASPKARRLAEEAGLDLTKIEGTGTDGRVMAQDVERTLAKARALSRTPAEHVKAQEAPPDAPAAGEAVGKIIPLTGVRGVIARRMSESARTTAAVTTTTQADATEIVRLREALREEWQTSTGLAPSYNDLLVVILAKVLGEFPYMNAHLLGEQIQQLEYVNIGLAVDTDRGLVVPVVKGAQGMLLADVMRASRDLVERAREGRLLPDDLSGGTFTLSNMGTFDVDASTPIINLPECAILGVGRIAPRPAVVNGELCVRETVTLSLTYDHRAIDGAPAARFLERVKQLVEQPSLALVR